MILAAGLGTRLRPLTEQTPKPLVEVAGLPMIAYPLRQLAAAGIRDVVVNVHYRAAQIREALGDGSAFGVRIIYSEEETLLGTGGAVQRASRWLAGDRFLVLNADSIHDVPLRGLTDFHADRGAAVTMVLRRDPAAARYGLIEIDAGGRIRRFLGRPAPWPEPLEALMFAGVSVWEPAVLDTMSPGVFSLATDTLLGLLAAGEPLYGWRYDGYWRVLDSLADLDKGRGEIEGGQRLSYMEVQTPI